MVALKIKSSVSLLGIVMFIVLQPEILRGSQAGGCGCPPLWTAFQDNCYRLFVSTNLTWTEAEMNCRSFSIPCSEDSSATVMGHLVSIHSREEMDFLSVLFQTSRTKRVPTWAWIGGHDQSTEDSFEWSDGSDVNYTVWDTNQPNDLQGQQDCVAFKYYRWNDVSCNSANVESFICKIPKW